MSRRELLTKYVEWRDACAEVDHLRWSLNNAIIREITGGTNLEAQPPSNSADEQLIAALDDAAEAAVMTDNALFKIERLLEKRTPNPRGPRGPRGRYGR